MITGDKRCSIVDTMRIACKLFCEMYTTTDGMFKRIFINIGEKDKILMGGPDIWNLFISYSYNLSLEKRGEL